MLRERIALEERQFQAILHDASPGMLPVRKQRVPLKEKSVDALDLYARGMHLKRIAGECGMHTRDVRRLVASARSRGDERAVRQTRSVRVSDAAIFISLARVAHTKIREAAERRGIHEADIVCRLVELIAKDDLVDAILDDADELSDAR